jgi:CPA1 family monovalent cation:H+ antiporter
MSPFEFTSSLLVIVSVLGIINHRYVHLPRTIGLLAGSLVLSIVLILIDRVIVVVDLRSWWRELVAINDLPHFFLDGALAFMLFAATLHVDLTALRAQKWTVLALTTIGVVMATIIYGIGMWFVFGGAIPLAWCMTLGALLAPTDPVAVGGLLREAGLPAGPLAIVNGESLFNDGVAVVIFLAAIEVASGQPTTVAGVTLDLLTEAGGGILLGLVVGYFGSKALAMVNDSALELIITLALVSGGYALSHTLNISGPLDVVVAGLMISQELSRKSFDGSSNSVIEFWDLADELLNALLFLVLGFSLLSIEMSASISVAAAGGIAMALVTRLISVAVPTALVHFRSMSFVRTVIVLTWGGLRGGISVALALTLAPSPYRGDLLAVCYAVVVFTILVQGLSMPRLVRYFYPRVKSARPRRR